MTGGSETQDVIVNYHDLAAVPETFAFKSPWKDKEGNSQPCYLAEGDLLSLITEADNSEIYRIEANLFTRNYMLVSLSAIMDQKQEREKLEQALAQVQKTKAALTTQLKALDLQEEQLKEQLETLKEIELAGMDAK